MRIDFGPSIFKEEGWVTVDIDPAYTPDIQHDLNEFPYPFKDGEADTIRCSHVLEHLKNPLGAIQEFQRILKPDGRLVLEFPHYSRNWNGCGIFPHSHICSIPLDIMDFFPGFRVDVFKLEWTRWPNKKAKRKLATVMFHEMITFFANLSPKFADRVWCYWVGGFDNVHIEAIKLEEEIMTEKVELKRREYHFRGVG